MTIPTFAAGTFVWTNFPFGPPDRPDIPGPVRHIAYVLGSRTDRAHVHYLLAYTSSGRWRHAPAIFPIGVTEFDPAASAALNQHPFHTDLRGLARLPPTAAWFPDLGQPGHGVVAVAGKRVRGRGWIAEPIWASGGAPHQTGRTHDRNRTASEFPPQAPLHRRGRPHTPYGHPCDLP